MKNKAKTQEKPLYGYKNKKISYPDFVNALKKVGISKGDNVFVHADVAVFGKPLTFDWNFLMGKLVDSIKEAVGKQGTIIMPTFTYSFCKGEVYDVEKTKSTVGVLTEYFRKLPGVSRNLQPIFSVAAWGKNKDKFMNVGKDSFDDNSIFKKLLDANSKTLFFGAPFLSCTFLHYTEQKHGIPYRYLKAFKGKIKHGKKEYNDVCTYRVRDWDTGVVYNLDRLEEHLTKKGLMKKVDIGAGKMLMVKTKDLFRDSYNELDKDIYYFLKEKPPNRPVDINSITENNGKEMFSLIEKLFPICRSITGNGVRETLNLIKERIPLTIHEVPTGKKVFDWTVPKEWNIKDAWIKDSKGNKIVDFKKNNLHVLNYSIPVNKKISLEELKKHLHTLPDHPDWIPYVASYYNEKWGFCMAHNQFKNLKSGTYQVFIDSELKKGHLTYGELYIKGKTKQEVLLSTYVCHPSMCNDNLSGIVLLTFLTKALLNANKKNKLKYSYRFLFIPETIGAITWLSLNKDKVKNIKHGLIATCVGDSGKYTYKKTRIGDAVIDKAVEKVLADSEKPYQILDFFPCGSDERQFCSPGFNLPVGSLMRTPYLLMRMTCPHFPEYHTSADNLDFVKPTALADSLDKYSKTIFILENNEKFLNLNPKCEPQLGKRGIYNLILSKKQGCVDHEAICWVLNLSDGKHSLLDIAIRSGMKFELIRNAADALVSKKLLKKIS